jgi:hypothetical protein
MNNDVKLVCNCEIIGNFIYLVLVPTRSARSAGEIVDVQIVDGVVGSTTRLLPAKEGAGLAGVFVKTVSNDGLHNEYK